MRHHHHWLSSIALLILFLRTPVAAGQSPSPDSTALNRAQEEFSQKHFQVSLGLYRNYLRAHPEDRDAWTKFAVSYYQTGQAQQALTYLRRLRPSPPLRNYNLFYQALSYDAIGDVTQAKRILSRLSRGSDSVAEEATFEHAALDFQDGNAQDAKEWAEDYLRRYKDGQYRQAAEQMLIRMNLVGKIDIPESYRSRYRSSFFAEHPLSLMPYPHMWYYQVGYSYILGTRSNPAFTRGEPTVRTGIGFEQYKLVTTAGLVLGPYKGNNGLESYIGYGYSQDWLSDGDRMKVYIDEPLDLQYFPFRPDLMERGHRFHAVTQGQRGLFVYGAYTHIELRRAGSLLFPAPERPEIRKAFNVSNNTLFLPWVEWSFLPDHRLRAYSVMEKVINKEVEAFSNKSYSLGTGAEGPFTSLSLQEESYWPLFGIKSTVEAFSWRYVFNDYWESYTSNGIAGKIEYKFSPSILVIGRGSFASNDYATPAIKTGSCSATISTEENQVATKCARVDTILNFGGSLNYFTSKQQALSLLVAYKSTNNDTLKVYNETELDILLLYSQAFPSLGDAKGFISAFKGLAAERGVF